MDEFGSPLAGGIRSVRRNISSSFFRAPQNSQPDSITTDLLQEQSLKLTSVSGQLQNISRQVSVLDFNIKSVRENIALGDQLERQREAARQNRERILAEQGLREGKESALEQKLQSALVLPLQRIGIKTQGILGQLGSYLLTLAGGWLTITGVDLLQSMAEGNVDKINKLKTKFLTGLTVILGSLTAMSLGMKKVLSMLSVFGGNVARIAFGGIFKASLFGVRLLLAGLVRKAAGLGGIGGGGFLASLLTDIALIRLFGGGGGKAKVGKGILSKMRTKVTTPIKNPLENAGKTIKKVRKNVSTKLGSALDKLDEVVRGRTVTKKYVPDPAGVPKFSFDPLKNTGGFDPKMQRQMDLFPNTKTTTFRSGGLLNRAKGLFNRGKNLVDDGVKAIGSSGIVTKAKNLTKGLPKVGVGKLLGKALGPFITFFSELLSEDGGLMSALAATAGFMAGAKVGAIAGGAIGALFGGVGAGPGAFIGALIGGFAGESVMKNLSKKIMNALGMKDVKVFGNKDGKNEEVEGVSADSTNVEPVKNSNLDAANTISNFSEDSVEVIMSQENNDAGGSQGVSGSVSQAENYIPNISFDKQNIHVLSTSAVLGVGD